MHVCKMLKLAFLQKFSLSFPPSLLQKTRCLFRHVPRVAKFSQSQQSRTRKRGKNALPFSSKALLHKHTQMNSNREAPPIITHLFSPALQLQMYVQVCVHWYSLCILGLHTCEMSIDADPLCLMAHTNLIFTFSEGN